MSAASAGRQEQQRSTPEACPTRAVGNVAVVKKLSPRPAVDLGGALDLETSGWVSPRCRSLTARDVVHEARHAVPRDDLRVVLEK
jgi:hypothetical protein